ncbi:MAG: ABC transporter ATP-binding protein [Bacillales bacterium]|nr:ABC transporter ATP-binding protein [Bacillales bacterium]
MIEVENVSKDYGFARGIFNVSFSVEKGEVLGYLGPNGAGKTTTIRHLMGFCKADEGQCFIKGLRCKEDASQIMLSVGYLPGEIALPENLTGDQFIMMMSGLRACKNKEYVEELCKIFELDLRGKTKRMSLGNKRKLALVTALAHDPEILILDEPTSALDPVMQERFITFLKKEKERGKIILLSSHIFSEVDAICDRIIIIKDGKLVASVRTDEIRHNQNKIYVSTVDRVKREYAIHDSKINDFILELSQHNITDFSERKFTLENYFMKFYEKEERQ